jgi:hypothetical protein
VGEGLKTRSVTDREEDASVMMGDRVVSRLAGRDWEGWASAWNVQAYSNSGAIGSRVFKVFIKIYSLKRFSSYLYLTF